MGISAHMWNTLAVLFAVDRHYTLNPASVHVIVCPNELSRTPTVLQGLLFAYNDGLRGITNRAVAVCVGSVIAQV